jgi:hypothetical protein
MEPVSIPLFIQIPLNFIIGRFFVTLTFMEL